MGCGGHNHRLLSVLQTTDNYRCIVENTITGCICASDKTLLTNCDRLIYLDWELGIPHSGFLSSVQRAAGDPSAECSPETNIGVWLSSLSENIHMISDWHLLVTLIEIIPIKKREKKSNQTKSQYAIAKLTSLIQCSAVKSLTLVTNLKQTAFHLKVNILKFLCLYTH